MFSGNQADGERMAIPNLALRDSCGSPPVLPRRSEFSVMFRENALLLPLRLLAGSHKTDGTVQTDVVRGVHEFSNAPSCILEGRKHLGPRILTFEHTVPSLDLSVASRVKGLSSQMAHPALNLVA